MKIHKETIVRAMIAVTFFICGGAIAEGLVIKKISDAARQPQSQGHLEAQQHQGPVTRLTEGANSPSAAP